MTHHRSIATAILLALAAVPLLRAQAAAPSLGLTMPDPALKFEAASLRQNMTGPRGSGIEIGSEHVTVRNALLRGLLQQGIHAQDAQFVGGPDWLASDRFDIVGKAPAGTKDADLNAMLVNLILERLAIKTHVESRSLPIYALVVARSDGKLGPDMVIKTGPNTVVDPCAASSAGAAPCRAVVGPSGGGGGMAVASPVAVGGGASGGSSLGGNGMTTAILSQMLSRSLDRAVVDRTGLTGSYVIKLRYSRPGAAPDPSPDAPPDLFTAVQEQLGLKLESQRAPLDVLVIDSATHPVDDNFTIADPSAGR